MGDLRNKAKAEARDAAIEDRGHRRKHGWTVFHFDFNPKLTKRDMTLGEAIRHLMRVTGTRIRFWRCPVRGLSIEYRTLPRTSFSYDQGETYRVMHFSTLLDEVAAKKELTVDMLLQGIGLYRGLPNAVFDAQTRLLCELLTAPPSMGAEEWLAQTKGLHQKIRPLLDTHAADLRCHLLGEDYSGPVGPVAVTVRPRAG